MRCKVCMMENNLVNKLIRGTRDTCVCLSAGCCSHLKKNSKLITVRLWQEVRLGELHTHLCFGLYLSV